MTTTTMTSTENAEEKAVSTEADFIGPTTAIPHPWQVKPVSLRSLPTKIILSFIVWGMFALLGLLAALIFKTMHVPLPSLPTH